MAKVKIHYEKDKKCPQCNFKRDTLFYLSDGVLEEPVCATCFCITLIDCDVEILYDALIAEKLKQAVRGSGSLAE